MRRLMPCDGDICNSGSAHVFSGFGAVGLSLSVGITRGTPEASTASKVVLCLLSYRPRQQCGKELCWSRARSMQVGVDGDAGESSVVDWLFK
jgi:hypothetical protein